MENVIVNKAFSSVQHFPFLMCSFVVKVKIQIFFFLSPVSDLHNPQKEPCLFLCLYPGRLKPWALIFTLELHTNQTSTNLNNNNFQKLRKLFGFNKLNKYGIFLENIFPLDRKTLDIFHQHSIFWPVCQVSLHMNSDTQSYGTGQIFFYHFPIFMFVHSSQAALVGDKLLCESLNHSMNLFDHKTDGRM